MRVLWGMLLVTACNQGGLPTVGEGKPPRGIYQVTGTVTANDCQPAPPARSWREGATFEDKYLFAPLPTPFAGIFGYEGFQVPYDGLAVELNTCGGQRAFVLEVKHFDDHDLDLERTTNWSNTAAAKPGCGGPVDDCSSIEDFHFTLLEPCPEPCDIKLTIDSATCSCPE